MTLGGHAEDQRCAAEEMPALRQVAAAAPDVGAGVSAQGRRLVRDRLQGRPGQQAQSRGPARSGGAEGRQERRPPKRHPRTRRRPRTAARKPAEERGREAGREAGREGGGRMAPKPAGDGGLRRRASPAAAKSKASADKPAARPATRSRRGRRGSDSGRGLAPSAGQGLLARLQALASRASLWRCRSLCALTIAGRSTSR